MLRNEWEFEFKSESLAEAARNKTEHHKQRLEFWSKEQDKVIVDVKEKGLSVEESLAGSQYSNRGHQPQIVVDNVFQHRLNEAASKVKEHTAKVTEYDGWRQVLEANSGRTYKLNADDFLFFFGK